MFFSLWTVIFQLYGSLELPGSLGQSRAVISRTDILSDLLFVSNDDGAADSDNEINPGNIAGPSQKENRKLLDERHHLEPGKNLVKRILFHKEGGSHLEESQAFSYLPHWTG